MNRVIFWDFDGTLGYREDLWRGALMGVLNDEEPGHAFRDDDLRHSLKDRFPWHRPERPHPELSEPEAWWGAVEPILARTFEELDFDAERSRDLAHKSRLRFVDPAGYRAFEDARPVLESLSDWRHVILSNHMPELEKVVEGIGLRSYFDTVISSALVGYEKPHRKIFEIALNAAGNPDEAWMVGDNPVADVEGAEAAGIPAILVRTEGTDVKRQSVGLEGVIGFVNGSVR